MLFMNLARRNFEANLVQIYRPHIHNKKKHSIKSWDQPAAVPVKAVLLLTLLLRDKRPPSKSTSSKCAPTPCRPEPIWAAVWKECELDDTRCWYSRSFSLRARMQTLNNSQSPKFIPLRDFNSSRLQLSRTRPLTLFSVKVREYWSAYYRTKKLVNFFFTV